MVARDRVPGYRWDVPSQQQHSVMQQLHCEGNSGLSGVPVVTPPAMSVSWEGLRDFRVSRWRESLPNFFSADTRLFFIDFKSFLPRAGKRRTGGQVCPGLCLRMRFLIPSSVIREPPGLESSSTLLLLERYPDAGRPSWWPSLSRR